jgi:L-ascorbate metabolism protein UlaG (beta-lactamase superfamily)
MRITHLGHSCLLVESDGARVLIDPGTFSSGFEQLTELDAVLITHQHPDHVDVERLPQLLEANDAALLLAEPETAAELSRAGIEARPLHPGERHSLGGLPLHATGGRHAVIHPDLPRVGNVALLLGTSREDGGDGLLLHPGDSYDVVPADVDLLALPLWAPWAKVSETVDYLRAVSPAVAVPIHEAPLQPQARNLYLTHCTNLAPEGTVVRAMQPGVATNPLG